jgi:hypothetical protein
MFTKEHFVKVSCPNGECSGEITLTDKDSERFVEAPDYPVSGRYHFQLREGVCPTCGARTIPVNQALDTEFMDLEFSRLYMSIEDFNKLLAQMAY